ncbi:MAG: dTDP-4-dehydrorhamnose 3,5-epimerase [Deltaproteobacteria bacterium]|nr:dTDP-4-dehydrorhamnose 3,5-epimerase [Deltaproteobacteria bacterium]
MPFVFTPLDLPEVLLIEPKVFSDERGFFMETYKRSEFARCGIQEEFVQCNHSFSTRGTLRGLHYQNAPRAQGKLVRAAVGAIFDVAVDLRKGSPRYGQWAAIELSAENKRMLYIPAGFAHGACVTSEQAVLLYMVTDEYAPDCERGVLWNDPALGITWPIATPTLSRRDQIWPPLAQSDNGFDYTGS